MESIRRRLFILYFTPDLLSLGEVYKKMRDEGD